MTSMRSVLSAAVSTVALLVSTTAFAQTEGGLPALITDRPDFTESSEVVGRGLMQIEMGTTFASDGLGDVRNRNVTLPLALVRIGVSPWAEIRLSSDGFVVDSYRRTAGSSTTRGGADMEVGAKLKLRDGANGGFALAVIPMASLPTGSSAMTSGTVDPTVKFTWGTDLPKDFALSGNVNVSRLSDDLGRFTEHALSISLGHDLSGGWAGYWEVFGFVPQGRSNAAAWTANGGVTHAIGGNAQVDFEVGRGLTSAAPDWFVGAGLAIRTASLRRR